VLRGQTPGTPRRTPSAAIAAAHAAAIARNGRAHDAARRAGVRAGAIERALTGGQRDARRRRTLRDTGAARVGVRCSRGARASFAGRHPDAAVGRVKADLDGSHIASPQAKAPASVGPESVAASIAPSVASASLGGSMLPPFAVPPHSSTKPGRKETTPDEHGRILPSAGGVSCSTVDTTLNLAQICSQPPPVCDNNTCTVTAANCLPGRVGGRRPLRPSSGRPEPGPKRYDRSGTNRGTTLRRVRPA